MFLSATTAPCLTNFSHPYFNQTSLLDSGRTRHDTPSRSNPGKKCPRELYSQRAVSYKRLRAFGCKAWRLATEPQRDMLDRKGRLCLHLYSLPEGDCGMLWDVGLQRHVKSRDVIFHKQEFPGLGPVGRKTTKGWCQWDVHFNTDTVRTQASTPPSPPPSTHSTPQPPADVYDPHLSLSSS